MKDIDSFSDKLDLPEPEEVEIKYEKPKFHENKIDDAEDDYKFLRNRMRKFMASGELILSKAINSVSSDPSPRGIESASLILRNILKISDNILNLHKDSRVILKEDKIDDPVKDDGKISASLVDIIAGIHSMKNPDKE